MYLEGRALGFTSLVWTRILQMSQQVDNSLHLCTLPEKPIILCEYTFGWHELHGTRQHLYMLYHPRFLLLVRNPTGNLENMWTFQVATIFVLLSGHNAARAYEE